MDKQIPSERKRSLVVKAEEPTPPEQGYGHNPWEQPVETLLQRGIINLDKPTGPTSHEVASWVKKILEIDKAGHSGTLDPDVSGLLPILLGDGTKIVNTLLNAGKEYICLLKLHQKTPKKKIKQITEEFTGDIYQRPPLKSAVKRETRIRTIYYLEVLEIEDTNVLLQIGCQAGTYIRKLCHDIGEALGCGAHMQELRRTKTGSFQEDETLTNLHRLKDAYVYWKEDHDETEIRKIVFPLERGLEHLPRIIIRDTAVDAICHGAPLAVPGILQLDSQLQKGEQTAIFTQKGEAVALGETNMTTQEILEKETGIAVKTTRVIMRENTYPRVWKTHK